MGLWGFSGKQEAVKPKDSVVDMTHYVANQAKYASTDIDSGKYGKINSTQKVVITITIDGKTVSVSKR